MIRVDLTENEMEDASMALDLLIAAVKTGETAREVARMQDNHTDHEDQREEA